MQKAEQYRQFAETLMIAAESAAPPTRELMLGLARTWSQWADEADDAVQPAANVISFARHRRAAKAG